MNAVVAARKIVEAFATHPLIDAKMCAVDGGSWSTVMFFTRGRSPRMRRNRLGEVRLLDVNGASRVTFAGASDALRTAVAQVLETAQ